MANEPLVLVPPMLCDARIFYEQIADLSVDHAVLFAPTTQGERMEEVASQILSWSPPKFALAGMGMGGMIAMEVLRRAPERVTRVAFMDTNPLSDTPEAASEREPHIIAARSGRLEDVLREEMNPSWLAPETDKSHVMAFLSEMANGLGAEAYVRQARAMQRRKDQQATMRKVKQPALVLCGEHDGLYPVRRHEFLAELIPYAQLEIIAGAGHLPTIEAPKAVNAALRKWMTQPLVLR